MFKHATVVITVSVTHITGILLCTWKAFCFCKDINMIFFMFKMHVVWLEKGSAQGVICLASSLYSDVKPRWSIVSFAWIQKPKTKFSLNTWIWKQTNPLVRNKCALVWFEVLNYAIMVVTWSSFNHLYSTRYVTSFLWIRFKTSTNR